MQETAGIEPIDSSSDPLSYGCDASAAPSALRSVQCELLRIGGMKVNFKTKK